MLSGAVLGNRQQQVSMTQFPLTVFPVITQNRTGDS
jgi:hypothetical protein